MTTAGLGFRCLAWGGKNRGKGDSGPPSGSHSTPAADAHAPAQQDSAAERPAQRRLFPHGSPMGEHKPTATEWGSQVRAWGGQIRECFLSLTSAGSLSSTPCTSLILCLRSNASLICWLGACPTWVNTPWSIELQMCS